jgi:carboxymethylenebutenolidase
VTTEIARFMRRLEATWDEHVAALLDRRDADAAMSTMTTEPSVRHLPTMTGADGRPALGRFYREALLPYLPGELGLTRRSRIVDRFRLVDELTVSFRHDCELAWLIPGLGPTGRRASVTAIVIVEFERGAIKAQRTHWDHASLASQLGVEPSLSGPRGSA